MASPRATSGFKTKGSRSEIVTPTEFSGSNTLEKYDQGVYVNDVSALVGPATVRMRPNNDFLKVKGGVAVQVTEGAYDDTEAPSPLVWVSGSVGSVYQSSQIPVSFFSQSHPQGGKGSGYTVAPSHFQLDNDFGQPDTYQDGTAYEETTEEVNPLTVIETSPFELVVPFHVVNAADQTSMDGLIDAQDTRKKIERDLEIPFPIRGTWADLGASDTYRRSPLLADQAEALSVRGLAGGGLRGTDAFLDEGDEFGLDDILGLDPLLLASGSSSPEGFVKPPTAAVTPFSEAADRELTSAELGAGDVEMRALVLSLTGSRNFPTHDYLSRGHVSLSHGYDYDIGDSRIDSRAFGGLLK